MPDSDTLQWVGDTFATVMDTLTKTANCGCDVRVENNTSFKLQLLGYYCDSGWCRKAPTDIPPREQEACGFTKTANIACGAVGILAFRIVPVDPPGGAVGELVIYFCVPYSGGCAYSVFLTSDYSWSANYDCLSTLIKSAKPAGALMRKSLSGIECSASMDEGNEAGLVVTLESV